MNAVQKFLNLSNIDSATQNNYSYVFRLASEKGYFDIVEYLLQDKNANSLSTLNCFHTQLTNQELMKIIEKCSHFQSFRLSNCPNLTDESIKALAKNCKNIKEIYLNYNQITDETVEAIAENCKNLERIDLSFCRQITDRSIRILIENYKDRHLIIYLDGVKVKEELIVSLKETHRGILIFY